MDPPKPPSYASSFKFCNTIFASHINIINNFDVPSKYGISSNSIQNYLETLHMTQDFVAKKMSNTPFYLW